MADQGEWWLAVDFGTSNTTAMIRVDGVSRPVVFDQGAVSMPSNVLWLDDGFRTGRTAQNQWRLAPERYERAPKRRIGRGDVLLGPRTFAPEELVAAVLKVVIERARLLVGGRRLTAVALSHPQEWSPGQRDELVRAARKAGIGDLEPVLVAEPVAAALRYESADVASGIDRALVFDFGGGTCDVTLLGRGREGAADVIVTVGDPALGGIDFDERLTVWVLDRLTERGMGAAVERLGSPAGLGARLSLLSQVQLAKEALSENATAAVAVTVGEVDTVVQITRSEYEALIESDVQRAAALVTQAMQRGGVEPGRLQRAYLTGGSAQTPAVVDAVRSVILAAPAPFEDVKLVVAEGALLMLDRVHADRGLDAASRPVQEQVDDGSGIHVLPPIHAADETGTGPHDDPSSDDASSGDASSDDAVSEVSGAALAEDGGGDRRDRHRVVVIAAVAAAAVVALILVGVLAVPPVIAALASGRGPVAGAKATSAPVITCWDGTRTSDACPRLTGEAAIHWVFQTTDGHDFTACTRTLPDLDAPVDAIVTGSRCWWKDLPHTTVYLYEFADNARGVDYQSTSAGLDLKSPQSSPFSVSGEELGDEWTGTGTDRHTGSVSAAADVDEQVLLFHDIPFGYRIVTDTTDGGTHTQQQTADDSWLALRDGKDIRAMQETLKR